MSATMTPMTPVDPIAKCQGAFFLCSRITNPDGTDRNVNFSMELYRPGAGYATQSCNHYLYPIFLKAFQWLGNIKAPNGDLIVIVHDDAIGQIPQEHQQMMDVLFHFIEGYFNARVYTVRTPDQAPKPYSDEITRDQVPGPVDVILEGHKNTMLIEITPKKWSFRAKTLVNNPSDGTYIDGILMDEMEVDFRQAVNELVETHGHYYRRTSQ